MILTSTLACATAASSASLPAPVMRSVAYVAYWDHENGFASIEQNLGAVTEVSPWWYALDAAGNVGLQDPSVTHIDDERLGALRAGGIRVIPTISNHRQGDWDDEVVGTLLQDEFLVTGHIQNLVDLAVERSFDGIDIDYENLEAADRDAFSKFVARLARRLHEQGKQLSVDLHAKSSDEGLDSRNIAQDYAAIGIAADQARIMTYDYHWANSEPGPVAPIDWVDEVLSYATTQIPKQKIVVGLSLVGYDWAAGSDGEVVTWTEAQDRAHAHSASILRDEHSKAPWFTYTDDTGRDHVVWFEDHESIAAKLQLVRDHGLSGVFFWRAGGEQPTIWPMVEDLIHSG